MLALYLTAELEGITDLRPVDTAEHPFYYTFSVQCTSCRETHPKPVNVSRFESHEQSGSRGEANFVWKCKTCKCTHMIKPSDTVYSFNFIIPWHKKHTRLLTHVSSFFISHPHLLATSNPSLHKREHSATIKAPPETYKQSSPAKRQKILELDCRGLEFTVFHCEGEFEAAGTDSGTSFTSIDLGEGEWFEYDEKAGAEVSVKDCKWEVARA